MKTFPQRNWSEIGSTISQQIGYVDLDQISVKVLDCFLFIVRIKFKDVWIKLQLFRASWQLQKLQNRPLKTRFLNSRFRRILCVQFLLSKFQMNGAFTRFAVRPSFLRNSLHQEQTRADSSKKFPDHEYSIGFQQTLKTSASSVENKAPVSSNCVKLPVCIWCSTEYQKVRWNQIISYLQTGEIRWEIKYEMWVKMLGRNNQAEPSISIFTTVIYCWSLMNIHLVIRHWLIITRPASCIAPLSKTLT